MSRTYINPPLVEIIAELRWGPPTLQLPQSAMQAQPLGMTDEELYMQLGSIVAREGYDQFERVMPPGFPVPPHQVVYRYRQRSSEDTSLYQIGNGVFTVNATPPYKSWQHFSPKVASGVTFLADAFQRVQRAPPQFDTLLVRYIDAFRSEMVGNRDTMSFLCEILGVDIRLPEAIVRASIPKAEILPSIQLQIPVKPGTLQFNIGHGQVNGEQAVIMDMTVASTKPVQCVAADVMEVLAECRLVIHDIFVGMTGKLDRIMQPQEP